MKWQSRNNPVVKAITSVSGPVVMNDFKLLNDFIYFSDDLGLAYLKVFSIAQILVAVNLSGDAMSTQTPPENSTVIDWSKCILCKRQSEEHHVCLANSKQPGNTGAGYNSLAESLLQFSQLDAIPFDLHIEELDQGEGVSTTLRINRSCWHKSCRNKINSTELRRAVKRKSEDSDLRATPSSPVKTRRSSGVGVAISSVHVCFFCDKSDG